MRHDNLILYHILSRKYTAKISRNDKKIAVYVSYREGITLLSNDKSLNLKFLLERTVNSSFLKGS